MTKKGEGVIAGLFLVLICVCLMNGISAGWNLLDQCANAIGSVTKGVAKIAFQLRNELGITDWLRTKGIYAGISAFMYILTGYALSRKEKEKLLGFISAVVGVISTILTFK